LGQAAIAANETPPTLVSHGIAVGDGNKWLDLRVAQVGTITAYTATLWLWMGATASWVRLAAYPPLANTDGVCEQIIGIELDGAATRFDWTFTGLTTGITPDLDWEYRLG
jgi:hypothetical protein